MNLDHAILELIGLRGPSLFPLAVSSLQGGIYAFLKAAGIGPSSVVSCDPLFPFGALAALHTGATVKFQVLEDDGLLPAPQSWKFLERERVDAVIATAVFGCIPKIPQLHHAKVFLDAAHSPLCTFTPSKVNVDAVGFSFASGKPMSCGEGGLVVFEDPSFREETLRWCRFGVGDNDVQTEVPGLNLRMSPALVDILRASRQRIAKLERLLEISWLDIYMRNSSLGTAVNSSGSCGWFRPLLATTRRENMPSSLDGKGIRWKLCYLRHSAVDLIPNVPPKLRAVAEKHAHQLVWYRPQLPDPWED